MAHCGFVWDTIINVFNYFMEQEYQEPSFTHPDSGKSQQHNRLLLIVVVGVVLLVALYIFLFANVSKQEHVAVEPTNTSQNLSGENLPFCDEVTSSDEMVACVHRAKTPDAMQQVVGMVTNIYTNALEDGTPEAGKHITLSVVESVDADTQTSTTTTKFETREYTFFVPDTIRGSETVAEGEQMVIYFKETILKDSPVMLVQLVARVP